MDTRKTNSMRKLSQSQTAVIQSELAFAGKAQNVISVRLRLWGLEASAIKAAAEQVFASADIFTAELIREREAFYFHVGSRQAAECSVLPAMEEEEAKAYMEEGDCRPLGFPEELCRAVVIPIEEGGAALYVRFHHVIMDGYGMSLFAQRVLDVLSGKEAERSVFFKEESGEAHADRESAEGKGIRTEDRDFWAGFFRDAEFEPAIFAEVPRSLNRRVFEYSLDRTVMAGLERTAAACGVSIPYVLAGAYAVYLAEATDKKDAVFLMPRLNRLPEERDTLGCFTLLVPVRVHIEQGDSFARICRRVQEAAQEASARKQTGFGEILNILRDENVAADSLSEYVFNFYRFQIHTDLTYQLDISVAGAMHNHLTWSIFRKEDSLSFRLDMRDGVYDEERAGFFIDGILQILERADRETEVGSLSVTGKKEEEKLLAVRGREIEIDRTETIPSLFRKAAAQYKDRPALYAGKDSLTFGELDRVSDRIAAALMAEGVESGSRVAFMLPRDIRLIPTMLGILKTGAIFIPVDPGYPRDRVRYILEDSDAAVLISSGSVEEASGHRYLEVDDLLGFPGTDSSFPRILQDQPAYMIYTSGTTGRPKGVILSHRGIINIVHPENNPFNRDIVRNCRGITAIGSICFDISLFEIFVPLLNGLFVELGNEKSMLDAGELAKHILAHKADILHCTPSRIVSYLGNSDFVGALQTVKAVLSAGEVLPRSLVDELKNDYGIRIYNGYGPTETTIGATITEDGDEKTIGRPIANMGVLLLNRNRKIVPYGAAGEICIYGLGVGLGYRNRPEETAEKFTEYQGRLIYRTGDIGHFAEDGSLIYHGRNDRQIKLRGLRIELSEIEKVIGSFKGISQVHCMIRTIDRMEHLAAFYTAETGKKIEQEKLLEHMRRQLTSYMVPDILKELESMPQTPGGKTDLKALKQIPIEYSRQYRAPKNRLEKQICLAFSSVLDKEKVGADDNFFEMGGDSLSVPALLMEIEDRLETEGQELLEFGDIFKYPTPALIAEKIAGKVREEPQYRIDGLDYSGIDEYLSVPEGREAVKRNLGNILLTGVTGYLGIHILIDLLGRPESFGKVFCLARGNAKLSASRRVRGTLFYYAEEDFTESYGSKWEVVEGDITDPRIFREEFNEKIDTIINSAANVAHFAYGDALEQVNTRGVENLIEYAVAQGAELCQVSTISVGGVYRAGEEHGSLTEQNLYIGQEIHNQYIYSKYLAEYAMLRAGVDRGLSIKLMRVGNLQGRSRDGEFQMNMKTNAFTRRLAAYIRMGAIPRSVYDSSVNFSPVDETAHMIVSLAMLEGVHTAFHVYPPEEAAFNNLVAALEKIGHRIRLVSDEEFGAMLRAMKKSREGADSVEGLLTDINPGEYWDIPILQSWTNHMLELLGECWQPLTEEYLNRYLLALDGMDMF